MVRIVVLASFNMDLVMRAARRPLAGETLQGDFAFHLGGKGFNQAIAARRLGADVAVIGRVGDDEFGRRFLAALDAEEIDRGGVSIDSAAGTGVASIIVEPDGANSIVQAPQANRNVTAEDVAQHADIIASSDVALLQLETSTPAAIAFARVSHAGRTLVVLNPAPAAPVPAELIALADVIVPNEIEAAALTGIVAGGLDAARTMAASLVAGGAGAAAITLGDQGAITLDAGIFLHTPAIQVAAVDTVGAGDAFCAALAVRLGEGATLADALRFANAAGALACTRAGAEPSMPRRAEVDALLAKGTPS